ncbi:UDP-N-acetylmuramoyl-L-alanine--D-glutamate ligase [Patescibacteria group bacterium]|nr:UDP-N-acetylmuramoyl-L-alanine--D-glutamate ligase [Patescibacteria group bacterium]
MKLNGKKIAVLGAGREGRALAHYFKRHKICADFLDQNEKVSAEEIVKDGFNLIVGKDAFSNLSQYDIIFRSPGVSPHLPDLCSYNGTLTSLTRLFFDLWPGKTIGVTGTKGKGTTVSLIKTILDEAQLKSIVTGNIGVADLTVVDNASKSDWAVVELSSFQLMDLGASPNIAVMLDVNEEHLDYHKSLNDYHSAKLEIVRNQKNDDWLVITGANSLFNKAQSIAKSKVLKVFGDIKATPSAPALWWQDGSLFGNVEQKEHILSLSDVIINQPHNSLNVAASVAVAKILGIKNDAIRRAVKKFKGLSQRLEEVATINGVLFINDSASTNPNTTIAAIKAHPRAPLILLVGGKNKGLDYSVLVKELSLAKNIKMVYVFGDLARELPPLINSVKNEIKFEAVSTLPEALGKAKKIAKNGDTILFSPGGASFDQFENYVVRGQQFNKLVYEQFSR